MQASVNEEVVWLDDTVDTTSPQEATGDSSALKAPERAAGSRSRKILKIKGSVSIAAQNRGKGITLRDLRRKSPMTTKTLDAITSSTFTMDGVKYPPMGAYNNHSITIVDGRAFCNGCNTNVETGKLKRHSTLAKHKANVKQWQLHKLETASIASAVASHKAEHGAIGQTLGTDVLGFRAGAVQFAADTDMPLHAFVHGGVSLIADIYVHASYVIHIMSELRS